MGTKYEEFLNEIHELELKYNIKIGEAVTFDWGTEIELIENKPTMPFEIIHDYGHYVIFRRSSDVDVERRR